LSTLRTESAILTSVIDSSEEREIGVHNIPGEFLHAELPAMVHMKVTGDLAQLLNQVFPEFYSEYTVMENGKEFVYLVLTWVLLGNWKSALQFWRHLSEILLSHGYTLNPYDPCVPCTHLQFWKHLSENLLSHGYTLNPYDPCVANKLYCIII
jgi:hypothetical protein